MNITTESSIGGIVAQDYRTAGIFQAHGIDFCCKGNRSIAEVSTQHGIEPNKLLNEIAEILNKKTNETSDYQSWPLDLLSDYIEKKHHRYVEDKIPVLKQYLNKLCQVHGGHHPELFEITDHFNQSAGELVKHMKKEELILFPFVRKMVKEQSGEKKIKQPFFETVKNPVKEMMNEHENEGDRFRLIAELSNNYTAPEDGCSTYRVTYAMLQEFEQDLHVHIHLENNILFPKAIELENTFS